MTYVRELYRLWYDDLKARRRFQVSTILIAFAYGVFNSLILGRSEKQVTWETVGVICFLMVAFSAFYCFQPHNWHLPRVSFGDIFRVRMALALGLTSVIFLLGLSLANRIPLIARALVNLQLRQAVYSPYRPASKYAVVLLNRNLPEAAAQLPTVIRNVENDPSRLQAALEISTQLLNQAKDQQVPISRGTVAQLGEAVINSSAAQSVSQVKNQATSAVLNYQSFLTAGEIPSTSGAIPVPSPELHTRIEMRQVSQNAWQELLAVRTSRGNSPLLTQIGKENESSFGPGYLVLNVSGYDLKLDGEHFRNVIIRNARIVYEGSGPLILEHVYFENCTFDIKQNDRGKQLIADVAQNQNPYVNFDGA